MLEGNVCSEIGLTSRAHGERGERKQTRRSAHRQNDNKYKWFQWDKFSTKDEKLLCPSWHALLQLTAWRAMRHSFYFIHFYFLLYSHITRVMYYLSYPIIGRSYPIESLGEKLEPHCSETKMKVLFLWGNKILKNAIGNRWTVELIFTSTN